jgi:SAM-dependent methyltransferase
MSVIWHDLECGRYAQDLELWRSLVGEYGDPVLDVGAGTGRVTLDLARRGHRVTALDRDPELLAELAHRAGTLEVATVLGDAREFELPDRFAVCLVPMQTIQLLGGAGGRARFLERAQRHLMPGGVVAIAISEVLELFEVRSGYGGPLPDICEFDGIVYASHPTAVRAEGDGYALERRRETVALDGTRSVARDLIHLDRLSGAELEQEAAVWGLRPVQTRTVPPTDDHVGSEVVILGV